MAINNPIGTAPVTLTLGKEREQWIQRAWDAIDESKLAELNRMMASIASPTGEGMTGPRSFSRWRRCTMVDHFRIT